MKKSLFALSLVASLLGNAFAMDLISIATNGAFNENSLGVKELSDQEMSEVVGGAKVTSEYIKEYGVVSNYGQNIYYTAYYKITKFEITDLPYFNLDSNYDAAVATTYDFRTNKVTATVVKIDKNNRSNIKTLDFQDNVKGQIKNFSEVYSLIQQHKSNIKYFKGS